MVIVGGQDVTKKSFGNSIAFGKSTSQRIYPEQHTPEIGWKLHKYGLKHALYTLDDHFRRSRYQKNKFRKLRFLSSLG